MFSQIYDSSDAEVKCILESCACPSPSRTQEILVKSSAERLSLVELADLLEIGAEPGADVQFRLLRAFTERRFRRPIGNHVRYIAPIYLSSHCIDACRYCNFSSARRGTARRRLSLEDLEHELAAVLRSGARVIELVLGTDPELPWPALVPYVAKTSELLRRVTGSGVLLCSDHLSFEAYVVLRDAGLWGMIQWDETLEQRAYDRWHATSPRKRHFQVRMDNHDRALAAGLEVATGALFGLADFRYEVLMQVAKARFLEAEYGRKPFLFGTARLKPIGERELHPASEVRDRAYETALMVYKIAEPEIGRWLQTRETFELNLCNLLDRDVFTYRCGEVTPGGYQQARAVPNASTAAQFHVHELTRSFVEKELGRIAFHVDYAWVSGGDITSSSRNLAAAPLLSST